MICEKFAENDDTRHEFLKASAHHRAISYVSNARYSFPYTALEFEIKITLWDSSVHLLQSGFLPLPNKFSSHRIPARTSDT